MIFAFPKIYRKFVTKYTFLTLKSLVTICGLGAQQTET